MAAKAKQYKGNIWIWESSIAYRREVEKVLSLVSSTQAGQTLIKHINSKKPYMLIQAFKPRADDPVNAFETPRSEGDGAPAGYVADSVPINIPVIGKVDIPTIIGTGKGTIVDIDYHPATWHEVAKRVGHIRPGDGAGEVLFHEMIHGLREMSGLMKYKDRVAGEEKMDSVEEFYAIMAANVYRSERGFKLLRADHWSSRRIKGSLVYQSAYYEHYQSYIDKWFKEQQAFGLDMARTPARFNPFREAAVALKLMTGPATGMTL
ncbi:MAG: M91 family zinc metallopeptidase [Acidobacteriota bacterium]